MHRLARSLTLLLLIASTTTTHAEEIGSVDTVFKFIGPDHKIVAEAQVAVDRAAAIPVR